MSACVKYISKSKSACKLAVAVVSGAFLLPVCAAANDFTSEKIMTEMDEKQRVAFLAGVVEGLAVARYMKDAKQKAGMECIYAWFYEDKQTIDTVYAAFEKYAAYPPGSVMDVLSKQKCGE